MAKGMGLRGCWRQWLATVWLIVAFAALALQAGAHTLPAAHTVHAERAVAASLDQGCDHSHAASGCARTPAPTSGPPAATIGLTYIPDIQFAPFYVAAEQGLFSL